MSDEQRAALRDVLKGGTPGPRDPVRAARLADQGHRRRVGQGRRRQVVRHGQPGARAGPRGPPGRRARRRHLRPLGARDARRRRRAPDRGRGHDHAGPDPGHEGHLHRHAQAQARPGGRLARADPRPGADPDAGRRLLGRPRLPAARPAARAPATWRSRSGRSCPNAEVLVVTTPQQAAAEVAERAGTMASMMNQRVIGVVENMSYLAVTCPHCGEEQRHDVFGSGGGEAVAQGLTTRLGYAVPCSRRSRSTRGCAPSGDVGSPIVVERPGDPGRQGPARPRRRHRRPRPQPARPPAGLSPGLSPRRLTGRRSRADAWATSSVTARICRGTSTPRSRRYSDSSGASTERGQSLRRFGVVRGVAGGGGGHGVGGAAGADVLGALDRAADGVAALAEGLAHAGDLGLDVGDDGVVEQVLLDERARVEVAEVEVLELRAELRWSAAAGRCWPWCAGS